MVEDIGENTQSENTADIMVVDDNPANLHLLSTMLRSKGYKIRPVPAGGLALRAAASCPPDLILLDISMPDMDGYEVCERLKADDRLKDIPVIFISALQETFDRVKAFSRGGVDYVTKPFQFEEVEARISTHLRLRRLQRELEHRNEELTDSFQRLKALEEMRAALTDMIVHDMRAPLTAILGYLDLVLADDCGLPDTTRRFLRTAHESSKMLTEMASTLLDVSRMESGEMPLDLRSCDLYALVLECLDSMRVLVEQKSIRPQLDGGVTEIMCDEELIRRVIVNLLHNALKYTPRGGAIQIRVESPEQRGARVSVTDSGCGIPEQFHARIFEKFGQVEARRHGHTYSSGLGLAFCRLAIQAHGGVIGVQSEPGKGSCFWFEIPSQAGRLTVESVPEAGQASSRS